MKNKLAEKILGIDYGERNVGFAFGLGGFTNPLKTIVKGTDETVIGEIIRIGFENKVDKIVLGLPVLEDGRHTQQTMVVSKFAKRLKAKIKIPVVTVNELLSTREALEEAVGVITAKKAKSKLDALSAEIILKRYYEEK